MDGGWGGETSGDLAGHGRPPGDPDPSKPQGPDSPRDRVLFECKYYFTLQLNPDQAYLSHSKACSPEKVKPFAALLIAGLDLCLGTLVLWKSPISGLVFGCGIREAGSGLGCLAFRPALGWGSPTGENVGCSTGAGSWGPPFYHGSQNHSRSGYGGDGEVNLALLFDAKFQLAGKAKWVSGPPDPLLFQLPCLFSFCQEEGL